ncbi:unnamed protein product, partial [Ectocarpus sp. 13 AM-2016]
RCSAAIVALFFAWPKDEARGNVPTADHDTTVAPMLLSSHKSPSILAVPQSPPSALELGCPGCQRVVEGFAAIFVKEYARWTRHTDPIIEPSTTLVTHTSSMQ